MTNFRQEVSMNSYRKYDDRIKEMVIESGHFKRPLVKTMREHFGFDISLYGGGKLLPI